MRKIIKNTTLSVIALPDGTIIPAESQVTIDPSSYRLFADAVENSEDIDTQINVGHLVVNDGVDDLSASQGKDFLRWPDRAFGIRFEAEPERSNNFVAKNLQEAVEEIRNEVRGKLLDFEFFSTGNTSNKWLNSGHPSSSSDILPFVAEWDGQAIGMSYANASDSSDTDLEFYVNGVLQYTWEIRIKRTAYNANSTTPLFSVSQGDRVSVFAKKVDGGTNPSNIFGEVIFRAETMPNGSGGTAIGV